MLLFSPELRQEGASFICDDSGKASGYNGLDLKTFDIEKLQAWVSKHDKFRIEYDALRIAMSRNKYPEHLKAQQISALFLCQILIQIYELYLELPSEAALLRQHEKDYCTALGCPTMSLHLNQDLHIADEPIIDKDNSIMHLIYSYLVRVIKFFALIAQKIRQYNPIANFIRLGLVRSRRLLDTVRPLLSLIHDYHAAMKIINSVLEPVFNWLAWVFFLPRLLSNLYQLAIRAIPGFWMKAEEKTLSAYGRISIQFHLLWPELFNDSPWCSVGVANCFFLVTFPVVAAILTMILFSYDVVLASVRGYFRLSGLYDLYDEGMKHASVALQEEKESILESLKVLDEMMVMEECRVSVAIVSTIGILIGAGLLSLTNSTILAGVLVLTGIPLIILANPIIPIVGAALILAFTVMAFVLNRVIDAYAPKPTVAPVEILPEKRRSDIETLGLFGKRDSPVRGRNMDHQSDDRFNYVSGISPDRI